MVILLWMVLGFLAGFAYVMVKRQIRPGKILTAFFLGLASAAAYKAFREHSRKDDGARRH